ncbi:hypothetical protein [Streptomyces pristinaespiralis]|uniref:hypothetical protein n=1 Tax=Streptomyces pristinaespiralis TaxID=38300 RepID=UPI0038366E5C
MTITPAPGGFDEFEMYQVLERACTKAGLGSRDARLLRGHTNAVLLLEKEQVVAKIARKGTDVESVARTVAFVRWLIEAGFPTVPLHPCDQPLSVDGHAVTFWTYLHNLSTQWRPGIWLRPSRRSTRCLHPRSPLPSTTTSERSAAH